jgi:hypothetical protein
MDGAKTYKLYIYEGEGVPLKEGEDYEVLPETENRKPIPSRVSKAGKRKKRIHRRPF